jgi:PIN domain nuclease of toxin-antitoxin system
VVAVFDNEVGGDEAAGLIEPGCYLSTVNLAEVIGVLRNGGWSDDDIENRLEDFDIQVLDFTRPQAMDAGFLRSLTSDWGLSLGDRACLALARELLLPTLTGDRKWANVDVGVQVHLFR